MEYEVKHFGKYGLHIILRKSDGFREGMKVKVIPNGHDKTTQSNTNDNTKQYNEIREKLLRDEEFLEIIITKLQEYARRW